MHYFSVHNIFWTALPERFGKWNRVWRRFGGLRNTGVFETFFDHLASLSSSAHLVQMFDSTIVRAHVSAAGAKGAEGPGARPLTRRRDYQGFRVRAGIMGRKENVSHGPTQSTDYP